MLDLLLAATLHTSSTVAIHTDQPDRYSAVCQQLEALDNTTVCVWEPSRGGPDTDVTLYLTADMNGALTCAITRDAIGGGRCTTETADLAPTWLNQGTTHQPYDAV